MYRFLLNSCGTREMRTVALRMLFMVLFTGTVAAQEDLLPLPAVRPFADMRFGSLLLLNRDPGAINQFGTEGHGSSFGADGTIGIDILWPHLIGTDINGSLRIGANIAGGSFTSDSYESIAFAPEQERSVPSTHYFTVDVSSLSVSVEARLLYSLSTNFSAFAGSWTTPRFGFSAVQREVILAPHKAIHLQNGQSERIVATGDALLSDATQYGIRMGCAFIIPIHPSLSLQQEVALDVNIGAWSSRSTASPLRPSIGCTFRLNAPQAPRVESVPPDTVISPALSLSIAAIDSSGEQRDTANITIHSVLNRRYIALPSLIQPSKTLHSFALLQPAEVAAYSPDSLQHATEQEIYRDLLNIIGSRMRADTSGALVLAATPSLAENTTAEAIRTYLMDIWSVDAARLPLQSANNTALPSGSTTFQPSSPALLAPLLLQIQEESIEAPSITIEKKLRDTDLHWIIEVQRDSRTIKTIPNTAAESGQHTLSLLLSDLASDTTQSALIARLTAVDSTGRQTSVADTLHIDVKRSRDGIDTIHTYVLFLPRADLAITTAINDLLLDHLREFMDAHTAVAITAAGAEAFRYASESGERLIREATASGVQPAALSITHKQTTTDIPPFIRIVAHKKTAGY